MEAEHTHTQGGERPRGRTQVRQGERESAKGMLGEVGGRVLLLSMIIHNKVWVKRAWHTCIVRIKTSEIIENKKEQVVMEIQFCGWRDT